MASLCAHSLCAVAGAVLLATAVFAQQGATDSSPSVRLARPIDNDQLVALPGNTSPFAIAKNDRGPVSTDLPMPDMTLVLSRSPDLQAAFDQYVNSEYDPNSPNYHRWLTPAEIGRRFGPSETDIVTITNWLVSQGFTVAVVTPDCMAIRFSGTAGLAESAFHTQIHNLMVNGVPHIGNMTDPQIPAALAPIVVGVKALHNFLPHPLHTGGAKVQFNAQSGQWQRVGGIATASSAFSGSNFNFPSPAAAARAATLNLVGPHPLFGINVPSTSDSSAYLEEDVTPWDFATIYNVTPLWNNNINGTGQIIAIAGTSDIDLSDVSTFRNTFGLPIGSIPTEIDTNGLATECTSTSSTAICGIGDLVENTLDVEWSGAVAPDAQIDLVVSGQNAAGTVDSIYDSSQYVVDNLTAQILNVSYGECELGNGTAENIAYYDLWQSAAAEGISVFVASGDSGSPSCDDGGDAIGNPYSAQYGLSVSGVASTPFNTAVGGTDFSWCKPTVNSSGNVVGCPTSSTSQGTPAYWNTSNNTTTELYESAAGYVPEIPWNDTCANPILAAYLESIASYLSVSGVSNAEYACNFVQNYWKSIYEEYGVMLAAYVDTVGGNGGASSCVVNDEDTDPDNPTCSTGASTANGSIALTDDGWQKPSWQTGVSGIPADGVRDLPDLSFFAGNGVLGSAYLVCISATGSCTYSSTSENTAEEVGGTSFGSPAMAGVMALINQKAGAAQGLPNQQLYQLASRQEYSNCSAEGPPASSCYFNSIDEGTNTMPCDYGASIGGAVYDDETDKWELTSEYAGIISPNCTPLNSGDTIGTLVGSGTTPAYNATAGFNLATGLGSMNVANVVNAWGSASGTATATMTVELSATSIASNTPLTISVTVAGSVGTPTGNVTVTGGGYSGSQSLSNGAASFTIPGGTLAFGSETLTVSYSGDSNYASISQIETLNVTALTATIKVTPSTTSIDTGQSFSVTVTVSANSSPSPTGSVTLASGGYSSGLTALSGGSATITIAGNTLSAGTDTLTATYSGDTVYASGTGTASVAVTQSTYSLSATTPSEVSPGSSATSSITGQSSSTGYTGAVTLNSCSLTSSSVTNPIDPPTCSVNGTITYSAGTPSGSGTATIETTSTTAELTHPAPFAEAGGVALAFLLFLGLPARRRSSRSLLRFALLLATLAGLSACGGGGTATTTTVQTSAGTYTFTVAGTGNDAASTKESTIFTLTVN